MRCDCCDRLLNDFESTRKSKLTGEYLNTCNKCLKGLKIETDDRPDLNPHEVVSDYDYLDEYVDTRLPLDAYNDDLQEVNDE